GIGARLASPILSNKIVPRIAHACAARAEDTPGRLLLCAHIIAGAEGNRERDDNPCQDHTHSPPSPFLMLPKTSIRMAKPVTLSVLVAFPSPARDFARLQPGPRFGKVRLPHPSSADIAGPALPVQSAAAAWRRRPPSFSWLHPGTGRYRWRKRVPGPARPSSPIPSACSSRQRSASAPPCFPSGVRLPPIRPQPSRRLASARR